MKRTASIAAFLIAYFALLLVSPLLKAQFLKSEEVLILYNANDPESEKLATFYQAERKIPDDQLLGLDLSENSISEISRSAYESKILRPLRDTFDNNDWWKRARNNENLLLPTKNKIRAIVLMRGIPHRISADPNSKIEADPKNPTTNRDEASLDSELALFGVETLATHGMLKNTFFNSDKPLSQANSPFFTLISRIDSPSYAICKNMIRDAIQTEQNGLWGFAYVDIANKINTGDQWLETIASLNQSFGIPTVMDRFNQTLPTNYPMSDAAIYYGWYERNVNGPFLKGNFTFPKGAIAVHIHSFSAEQISDPGKNWSAPILARGATATLGNVFEPYLEFSHNLGIFHDRLLKGWTLAEASWAATPVCSWQTITFGDPLYRPFIHLNGTGTNRDEDRDYRAIAAAQRQWPNDTNTRREKLSSAAKKLSSGRIAESIALDYLQNKDVSNAQTWFRTAESYYTDKSDKIRQNLHLAAIERSQSKNENAIKILRQTISDFPTATEKIALEEWIKAVLSPR